MQSHFTEASGIRIHYLDYNNGQPPLVLLHGLTANAMAFNGLVAAGLTDTVRLITPDLRGRGLSQHPAFKYSIPDHAADVLAMLDELGLQEVAIGGHSYGAYLSVYLAATYPERFTKVILMDAGIRMNKDAGEMLQATLSRLDVNFPSWEDYLEKIKAAPYNTFWDDAMEPYYRADVATKEDGTVEPRPNLAGIAQVAYGTGQQPWAELFPAVAQPTLLLHAPDEYTMGMPLLEENAALETVALMPDARYAAVPGNHQTMMYGPGARRIVAQIQRFLTATTAFHQ